MSMNLMMVPIAMSKGPIADDACGGAVQPLTRKINSVPLNSANLKVPKRSLFSRKLVTWFSPLKKEPIAVIPSIPKQNAQF